MDIYNKLMDAVGQVGGNVMIYEFNKGKKVFRGFMTVEDMEDEVVEVSECSVCGENKPVKQLHRNGQICDFCVMGNAKEMK